MTNPLETPPNWPRLTISIDARLGTVALAGATTAVFGASLADTRLHALEVSIAHAIRIGRPLPAVAYDDEGSWTLVVCPDGRVQDCHLAHPRRTRTVLLLAVVVMACLCAAGIGVPLVD